MLTLLARPPHAWQGCCHWQARQRCRPTAAAQPPTRMPQLTWPAGCNLHAITAHRTSLVPAEVKRARRQPPPLCTPPSTSVGGHLAHPRLGRAGGAEQSSGPLQADPLRLVLCGGCAWPWLRRAACYSVRVSLAGLLPIKQIQVLSEQPGVERAKAAAQTAARRWFAPRTEGLPLSKFALPKNRCGRSFLLPGRSPAGLSWPAIWSTGATSLAAQVRMMSCPFPRCRSHTENFLKLLLPVAEGLMSALKPISEVGISIKLRSVVSVGCRCVCKLLQLAFVERIR